METINGSINTKATVHLIYFSRRNFCMKAAMDPESSILILHLTQAVLRLILKTSGKSQSLKCLQNIGILKELLMQPFGETWQVFNKNSMRTVICFSGLY